MTIGSTGCSTALWKCRRPRTFAPDYGRYLEWDEARPGAAMRRAQELYGQWFDEELRAM